MAKPKGGRVRNLGGYDMPRPSITRQNEVRAIPQVARDSQPASVRGAIHWTVIPSSSDDRRRVAAHLPKSLSSSSEAAETRFELEGVSSKKSSTATVRVFRVCERFVSFHGIGVPRIAAFCSGRRRDSHASRLILGEAATREGGRITGW